MLYKYNDYKHFFSDFKDLLFFKKVYFISYISFIFNCILIVLIKLYLFPIDIINQIFGWRVLYGFSSLTKGVWQKPHSITALAGDYLNTIPVTILCYSFPKVHQSCLSSRAHNALAHGHAISEIKKNSWT